MSANYTQLLEPGKWSSGICDCFSDCRLCIISCIPVINALSAGQTYTVAHQKTGIMEDPLCGIVVPLVGLFFCPLLLCLQVCQLRGRFRSDPYNLPGNDCEDCMCSLCCGWCALQQCARHLQANPQHLKGDAYLFAPAAPNTMASDGKSS